MSGTKKILLVDDSGVATKVLESIIRGFEGYEIVGRAKNGAEGVKLYGELHPDVVLMDIVMPVMDGLKATQSILLIDQRAKVVVISSVGGARDTVVAALRLGAKSVIAKPYEAEAVRTVLDRL